MSDWTFLNRHRVRIGFYGTTEADGWNGLFEFALPGEARRIRCIASDGSVREGQLRWQHVAVSFGPHSTRTPPWELMCRIRDLFWEPDQWVVQFHPPANEYVNNHPGCLHLWRCLDQLQPTPDALMVGLRLPPT